MCGGARLMRRTTLLELAIAQIGVGRERDYSLAMLLEPSELPGEGWSMLSERCWRTGFRLRLTRADSPGRRARRAGSITAARSFVQATPSREMWVEVQPFVTEADAESVVAVTDT